MVAVVWGRLVSVSKAERPGSFETGRGQPLPAFCVLLLEVWCR